MWRDPYDRSWGERLFTGLLSLLALAVGLELLVAYLTPLIPTLLGAVVVSGVLLWFFRRPYR
jgi:CHASE2 domain-containing sensor protein